MYVVYLVESSDWAEHYVHSVWSSKGKAEAEICRLRELKIDGLLVYPKKRYSFRVEEYDVDSAT